MYFQRVTRNPAVIIRSFYNIKPTAVIKHLEQSVTIVKRICGNMLDGTIERYLFDISKTRKSIVCDIFGVGQSYLFKPLRNKIIVAVKQIR